MNVCSINGLFESIAKNSNTNDIIFSTNTARNIFRVMPEAEFADLIGVSEETVRSWENGDHDFTVSELTKIFNKLDLRLDFSIPINNNLDHNDEYNGEKIANRIKCRAKHQKIPLKIMLKELGFGINLISKISKGQNAAAAKFYKIAEYLDCSVDYLMCRTDNPDVNQ